jgi:hypothetical protein
LAPQRGATRVCEGARSLLRDPVAMELSPGRVVPRDPTGLQGPHRYPGAPQGKLALHVRHQLALVHPKDPQPATGVSTGSLRWFCWTRRTLRGGRGDFRNLNCCGTLRPGPSGKRPRLRIISNWWQRLLRGLRGAVGVRDRRGGLQLGAFVVVALCGDRLGHRGTKLGGEVLQRGRAAVLLEEGGHQRSPITHLEPAFPEYADENGNADYWPLGTQACTYTQENLDGLTTRNPGLHLTRVGPDVLPTWNSGLHVHMWGHRCIGNLEPGTARTHVGPQTYSGNLNSGIAGKHVGQ